MFFFKDIIKILSCLILVNPVSSIVSWAKCSHTPRHYSSKVISINMTETLSWWWWYRGWVRHSKLAIVNETVLYPCDKFHYFPTSGSVGCSRLKSSSTRRRKRRKLIQKKKFCELSQKHLNIHVIGTFIYIGLKSVWNLHFL